MSEKWIKKIKNSTKPHPTYERLVETVTMLLEMHLPENITTDMVLKHSGISRGSLYHHFEDLTDLLETCLVRAFASQVDYNIDMMRNLLLKSTTAADFFEATQQFNAATQASERREGRFERIRLIGFACKNHRMAKKLAKEQDRLTAGYVDLFKSAQEKGWISATLDPHAAAILIQAYTLGRVVDDVAESHVDPAAWEGLIMQVVQRVFGVESNT